MSSFGLWRKGGSKVKRITFVCGDQSVLAEEVAVAVRAEFAADQVSVRFGGIDRDDQIWDTYATMAPDRHLVAVRCADKLRSLDPITRVVATARSGASCFLLLISDAADFPREGGTLTAPMLALRDYSGAQMIRCSELADADLISWTQAKWPVLSRLGARQLVDRCHGDLPTIRDAIAKAVACDVDDEKFAVGFADVGPGGRYVDHVLAGERAAAFAAAEKIDREHLGTVLAELDRRLTDVERVAAAKRAGYDAKAMAVKAGIASFVVIRCRDLVGCYDRARILRNRHLLAVADAAWRSGARAGVAELVAANW